MSDIPDVLTSLSDPPAQSVLAKAAQWVEGTMSGPLATTIAVIAIATTGLMMLSGRINIRRGLPVLIGCFVLFGASTIARGLQQATNFANQPGVSTSRVERPPIAIPPLPPTSNIDSVDPYVGAAVPPPN